MCSNTSIHVHGNMLVTPCKIGVPGALLKCCFYVGQMNFSTADLYSVALEVMIFYLCMRGRRTEDQQRNCGYSIEPCHKRLEASATLERDEGTFRGSRRPRPYWDVW